MLCSGRSAFRFIGTCLHLIHRNTCSGKRMTVRLHFHTRTPTSSKKDFRRRTLLLYYYLALSVNISKNASFLFLPSGLTESGCKSTNFILTNKTFQELFTQNKAIFRVFWQKRSSKRYLPHSESTFSSAHKSWFMPVFPPVVLVSECRLHWLFHKLSSEASA